MPERRAKYDSILKTENEVDFLGKEAHRYALQKVYISWTGERNINRGDIVLFYRTGHEGSSKKYTSVLTTVCIVDEVTVIETISEPPDSLWRKTKKMQESVHQSFKTILWGAILPTLTVWAKLLNITIQRHLPIITSNIHHNLSFIFQEL